MKKNWSVCSNSFNILLLFILGWYEILLWVSLNAHYIWSLYNAQLAFYLFQFKQYLLSAWCGAFYRDFICKAYHFLCVFSLQQYFCISSPFFILDPFWGQDNLNSTIRTHINNLHINLEQDQQMKEKIPYLFVWVWMFFISLLSKPWINSSLWLKNNSIVHRYFVF